MVALPDFLPKRSLREFSRPCLVAFFCILAAALLHGCTFFFSVGIPPRIRLDAEPGGVHWHAPAEKPAAPAVIWNLAELGRLDFSNTKYEIFSGGGVMADLRGASDWVPAGLGNIADGKPDVKQIDLTYDVPAPGDFTLSIAWQPGGSGSEQFEVLANGTSAGKSTLREGQKEPYRVKTETFRLAQRQGTNTLTLRYLSGDGLHFQNLVLANQPIELDSRKEAARTPIPPELDSRGPGPKLKPPID